MQSVCDTFVSGFCCFHWTSPAIWYPSTWRFPEFSLPVIRFVWNLWRFLVIGPPTFWETHHVFFVILHHGFTMHLLIINFPTVVCGMRLIRLPDRLLESAACPSALEWDARNIIYTYAQTCDRMLRHLWASPCYGTHGVVGGWTFSMHPWTHEPRFFLKWRNLLVWGTHGDPAEAETLVFTGSRRHA